MHIVPSLSLALPPEKNTTLPDGHTEKDDRITGWRLLAIWTIGIAGSWAIALGIVWAGWELLMWAVR